MSTGLSLTDELRTFLYKTACEMFRKGQEYRKIKSPDCEALVRTQFQFAAIGGIAGTKFVADLEIESGKGHAEFIVRDGDLARILEEGVWTNFDSEPEGEYGRATNAWMN